MKLEVDNLLLYGRYIQALVLGSITVYLPLFGQIPSLLAPPQHINPYISFHDESDQMILRLLRADGIKLTAYLVNTLGELLDIDLGFQTF